MNTYSTWDIENGNHDLPRGTEYVPADVAQALYDALRQAHENADMIEWDSYILQGNENFQPEEWLDEAAAALDAADGGE